MVKPKLLVIIGPTGSGKTDLGIKLAKERNGAVISADSRQLYIGMSIGTATPKLNNSNVSGVDHYGFDMREPDNPMTLAEWQQAAFAMINYIESGIRNNESGRTTKTPILVGGTMLYIDSVIYNYDIPRVAVNEELRNKLARESVENLYEELTRRDPDAKSFIQPQNKRRIIRALEVIETTGRPFSQQRKKREPRYDVEMIGLFPGWNILRYRIAKRANKMLDDGLIDEVKQLQEKYGKDLPLLQTINYKQMGKVISGELTESEVVEEMKRVNMRYARRQMSWWRGRKNIKWVAN